MDLFNTKNKILLKELIEVDFKLRYQGSVIGHFWSILKPIMMFSIMYAVFVRFLKFGEGIPHFAVALLLGTTVFNFFAEATGMGMSSVVNRGDLMRKISFSKPVIVLSVVANAGINFLINLAVVLIFAVINGVQFNVGIFMIPLLLLELVILVVGISFILATVFVYFRDLAPVWEVFVQLFMYATPIIYPLSMVFNMGHPKAAKLLMLNPLAQIIQDMRYFMIEHNNTPIWQILSWKYAWIPYIIPFFVLGFGIWIFNKHSKSFAEVV
ncbi:MAG: ABC transporter permease [Lactobacillaceae bacterium]|jgi:ABC-2 type transport system permease protein|nr:ABC transporter permease [Lactobacillaceae bacterium]